MIDKEHYLQQAIEITKEHARGGGGRLSSMVLEEVYKKLLELAEDIQKVEE